MRVKSSRSLSFGISAGVTAGRWNGAAGQRRCWSTTAIISATSSSAETLRSATATSSASRSGYPRSPASSSSGVSSARPRSYRRSARPIAARPSFTRCAMVAGSPPSANHRSICSRACGVLTKSNHSWDGPAVIGVWLMTSTSSPSIRVEDSGMRRPPRRAPTQPWPVSVLNVYARSTGVLPAGSTPVDLAYTLSTETGHGCVGARRGGRLIPLSSTLIDGDEVEVISQTPITAGPSQEWLDFVKTPHARLQIDRWFADGGEPATIAHRVKLGRAAIGLALRRYDRGLADETPLLLLAGERGYPDLEALLVAVADRRVSAEELVAEM